MKLSSSLAAALVAAMASTANGKFVSKPFYLVLESDNSNLDGTALSTCHEGAAIESLCKGVSIPKSNPQFSTFKFQKDAADLDFGEITYLEDKQTHDVQPLSFYDNPGSNIALPLFGLGSVQTFSFDDEDRLIIHPSDANHKMLNRWYMCRQKFEAYTYNVLSWKYGTDPPDNKSCQKVSVKRVFE